MDNNAIILVTGGNRGIGKEVSRQLAEKGHTVILTARNAAKGEQAARDLGGLKGDVVAVQLDVTDSESIHRAAAEVEQRFGHIDVLVNNAGIDYDTDQDVLTADLDRVRRILDTNVLGMWAVTQAFVPLLRKSDHPRIVNVSSEAGSISHIESWSPGYSTSKAAVNAFTAILARELKRDGFLVNAVCPGWIATDMGGAGGGPLPDGGRSVIWAIELPDDGPTGGFFQNGKRLPW